jgi:thioredoxin 1
MSRLHLRAGINRETIMGNETPVVSDSTFDEVVLKSSEPVVVDFFAEWCGPCKAMAPTLDAVAADMKGKVKVVKVDVDKSPGITTKYAIQAMPTLIVFKGGEVKARQSGAMVQKKRLEDFINGALV